MPAEPAPLAAAPASVTDPAVSASLERAITLVRDRLEELHDARRRHGVLAEGWQGGHRERFDELLREIELRVRRTTEDLALVALAHRRARDGAGAP